MRPLWVGGLIAPLFAPLVFFLVVLLWSVVTGGVIQVTHDWEAGVVSAVIFVLPMSYLATWLLGVPYIYWLKRHSRLSTLRICATAVLYGVIATWAFQFVGKIGPLHWIQLIHGALIGGGLAVCVALPICWIVRIPMRTTGNREMRRQVYILDRNVLSDIRKANTGNPPKDIDLANSIDVEGNIVSTIFSSMEGNVRQLPTYQQFKDICKDEVGQLEKFYSNNKATVDKRILQAGQQDHKNIVNEYGADLAKYSGLIELVKYDLKLFNRLSSDEDGLKKARKLEDSVFEYATNNDIELLGIFGMCFVSAIYGNENSKAIIKPKPGRPTDPNELQAQIYNVVMDIETIKTINLIRSMAMDQKLPAEFHYLTRDEGLRDYHNAFFTGHEHVKHTSDTLHTYVTSSKTLTADFMPMLQDKTLRNELIDRFYAQAKAVEASVSGPASLP